MNQRSLRILEYNKIIEMLEKEAGSYASRQIASELSPYTDRRKIEEELRSTTEAVDLIVHKGPLPTGGIYDIKNSLVRAYKGGALTMKELLEIHYDLKIAQETELFMKSEDLPELPLIRELTGLLVTLPRLAEEIDRCILTEDEMADSASPKLREIRRDIGLANDAVKNRLNRIITSNAYRAMLQDAIVTMRDGRYVIPVKQEYRARVPGMIHDQSKGGQTLFIEPQAVVELNNRLRELEVAEQGEIARILAELSSRVAEHYKEIRSNLDILIRLDFIMAKGKLSRRMDAEAPKIDDEGVFELVKARHPLIDKKKVVPIDISIGKGYRTLIVTGPNTGGKTVSLKTAGLLTLMAQSGLHIPAYSTSRIPVFQDVFSDIGDEQSIEQSLSTFSSHMKNIVSIINGSADSSLILLDELGAGTDPTEGAALAISILETLSAQGAMIMATTHYNELKKYALSTEGVINAAMEFSIETLSPTYRLLIGVPGKSNAFEISKKLGLSGSIIDRANKLIEKGDIEFENVVSSIEEDRKRAEAERQEAESISSEMRRREQKLLLKEEDLAAKRAKIIEEAREEARMILRDARETSKDVQKELRELIRLESSGERTRQYEKTKRRLREAEEKYANKTVQQVNSEPVSADDIKIGGRVKVLTLSQNGSVLTLPDEKGVLTVSIGAMKINVNLDDIMLINDGEKKKKPKTSSKYGSLYRSKSSNVSASINVQGENLDDAIADIMKYIDDVYIAGLDKVTIIHGRGEGILKNGIRSMLKHNKSVASFAAGNYNEGGEGVTIVTMKKS